jgi:hypothetical protein
MTLVGIVFIPEKCIMDFVNGIMAHCISAIVKDIRESSISVERIFISMKRLSVTDIPASMHQPIVWKTRQQILITHPREIQFVQKLRLDGINHDPNDETLQHIKCGHGPEDKTFRHHEARRWPKPLGRCDGSDHDRLMRCPYDKPGDGTFGHYGPKNGPSSGEIGKFAHLLLLCPHNGYPHTR